MFWHLGPCWSWRDCPFRVKQFLETVNSLLVSVLFKCKPTNTELTPQHLLYQALTLQVTISRHDHLRSKYPTPTDSSCAPGPTETIHTNHADQSKLVCCLRCYHASPVPPTDTMIKAPAHSSALPLWSWPILLLPHVDPPGAACPFLLGIVSNKVYFHGHHQISQSY